MLGQFFSFPNDLMPSCVGHNLWKHHRDVKVQHLPTQLGRDPSGMDDLCCIAPLYSW